MPPRRKNRSSKTKDPHAALSEEDRKVAGNAAKGRGNSAYAAGEHATAIKEFSAAIAFEPVNHIYYSNRSAAYLSAGQAAPALQDANKCIELEPKWAKGYARLGAVQYFTRNYAKAVSAYTTGLTLDRQNKQIQVGLGSFLWIGVVNMYALDMMVVYIIIITNMSI